MRCYEATAVIEASPEPAWGVRAFEVRPDAAGGSRFGRREEYAGPLLRLTWRSTPDLQASFDRVARRLKRRVEGARSR